MGSQISVVCAKSDNVFTYLHSHERIIALKAKYILIVYITRKLYRSTFVGEKNRKKTFFFLEMDSEVLIKI